MELISPFVCLRELRLEDEPAIHELGSDPVVTRYTDWGPNTPEDTRAFLRECLDAAAFVPRVDYSFAVTLPDGPLAGKAGLHITRPEHRCGDVGYTIHPSYWGRGLATEAARLLLSFGFGELGLHRIQATCHPDNLGSRRVMEKAGMTYEGHLRDHKLIRDGWRDSLLFAVLAAD